MHGMRTDMGQGVGYSTDFVSEQGNVHSFHILNHYLSGERDFR